MSPTQRGAKKTFIFTVLMKRRIIYLDAKRKKGRVEAVNPFPGASLDILRLICAALPDIKDKVSLVSSCQYLLARRLVILSSEDIKIIGAFKSRALKDKFNTTKTLLENRLFEESKRYMEKKNVSFDSSLRMGVDLENTAKRNFPRNEYLALRGICHERRELLKLSKQVVVSI